MESNGPIVDAAYTRLTAPIQRILAFLCLYFYATLYHELTGLLEGQQVL